MTKSFNGTNTISWEEAWQEQITKKETSKVNNLKFVKQE